MCECLELSRSGYYEWKRRGPSQHAQKDESHKTLIGELHRKARGRYGHRPIYHHLREDGVSCGRDRTLRLMKEMGIQGRQRRRYKPMGTDSRHRYGYAPNRLKELGVPDRCDQIWVSDTTYLRTDQGWCYLATVMDLYSRRILGWSVSQQNDGQLVRAALHGAILSRGGRIKKGLIHHSDRGSTYASHDYTRMLSAHGIIQSMSSKGNCYDNAAMESFFGRYKSTRFGLIEFAGETEARSHVFEYIEVFYNRFRKHSSLGYQSPTNFEEKILPPMGGKGTASLTACPENN